MAFDPADMGPLPTTEGAKYVYESATASRSARSSSMFSGAKSAPTRREAEAALAAALASLAAGVRA